MNGTTSLSDVSDFLNQSRVAVVGVSRNPRDFSRVLFREFLRRGYDVVPVHPGVSEMEGRPCFASVRDIAPPVSGALLLTAPPVTESAVHDCAAAGVGRVWMFRAGGAGAVSPEAVSFCRAHQMRVVAGECPFMFFPRAGLIHRLHAWLRRITGRYPSPDLPGGASEAV